MEALRRAKEATVERRLLNDRGLSNFDLTFYALNKKGEFAGVDFYASERSKFAVCTENGPELLPVEPLLDGSASD